MIWFRKVWFLTLTLFTEQCFSIGTLKYSYPRSMVLRGNIGTFRQNLTGFPTEIDENVLMNDIMQRMMDPPLHEENTIQFITGPIEPFVFCFIAETKNGEDEFVVRGPMYSVVSLAVARLNYRY